MLLSYMLAAFRESLAKFVVVARIFWFVLNNETP